MQALATILPILMQVKEAVLGTALQRSIQCAICLMLQQSVERIARVRMVGQPRLHLISDRVCSQISGDILLILFSCSGWASA